MNNDPFGLFEQAAQISKAHAYDILREQVEKLTAENDNLRNRVKFLEDLIREYTGKMMENLMENLKNIP